MKKLALFVLLYFFVFFAIVLAQAQTTKEVQLTVLKYGLVIWTPANLNLGNVTAWSQIEKTFDGHFWVEDFRKWYGTGYYTTIQCDGLYWPNDFVITWMLLKWNSIEILEWDEWEEELIHSYLDSWKDITQPQLYFYKNSSTPQSSNGRKYWSKPSINVSIPSDAPAGDYKWRITYTLYDMSFDL